MNYNIHGFADIDTISFAGQNSGYLGEGMSYTITGTGLSDDGVNAPLAAQPDGQNPFRAIDPDGQWAAVNLLIYGFDSGTVTFYNGPIAIASYTWTFPSD